MRNYKFFITLVATLTICLSMPYFVSADTRQAELSIANNTFNQLFPDKNFAIRIANCFGKQPTDKISLHELAAYTGNLSIYGYISDLKGIGLMTGVTSISGKNYELTELPAEIKNLKNLKNLNLYKCFGIKSLPPEIYQLNKLEYINLYSTSVTTIPSGICELTNF